MQHVPLKSGHLSTKLPGVTSQKTVMLIGFAVGTKNSVRFSWVCLAPPSLFSSVVQ